jgi:hypothetical protein
MTMEYIGLKTLNVKSGIEDNPSSPKNKSITS